MKRVLQSLEMATLGNSGMSQDTRLLFKALVSSKVHDVTGLVMENAAVLTRYVRPRRQAELDLQVYDQSSYLLGLAGMRPPHGPGLVPGRVARGIALLKRLYLSGRYESAAFDTEVFAGPLWRLLFQRSLPSADRPLLGQSSLRFTNLTNSDCAGAVTRPFAPSPRLDTSEYDVAIFPDVRPIKVSANTVKVVRYHDTIPITEPDLLGEGLYTTVHYQSLRRCARDSHFVCNSEATRAALLKLMPALEPFAHVIPCALDLHVTRGVQGVGVDDIVRARRSAAALGGGGNMSGGPVHRYILMVAAIEPKKNIVSAVRAWERVRADYSDVKLVLVGNEGWATAPIYSAMAPHVASGDLLHLTDVPFVELQALMLNAELLLFPSYAEGFGYPPMEAMLFGTPAVVSDIASHRVVLGEHATFVDPYSPQDIAAKVIQVLAFRRGARKGVQTTAAKEHLAQFSIDMAAQKWNQLIASLAPRQGH